MEKNWVFLSMWRTCTSPSKTRFMSADSKFRKSMKRHRLFRQNQMWIQELFWGWSIPTKFANLFFKESKLFIFYYNYLSLLTSLKEGPYCHRGVLFGHLLFVACIYKMKLWTTPLFNYSLMKTKHYLCVQSFLLFFQGQFDLAVKTFDEKVKARFRFTIVRC